MLVLEDRLLLTLGSGLAAKTLPTPDKHLISEKAYFKEVSAETALFMGAGPKTPGVIERLTG